ncbi:MAG: alpha,alpha-trehalase [Clostridia bacterium]|nr:alpha,alpha-trehalase [Clostridia bacterium]
MNTKIRDYINENIEKTVRYTPDDDGTLIGLPYPYTAPCANDHFQELYYWDTHFTNIGMILFGRTDLAKSNVDNMLHLVDKYGFMPNGNRTFYLNRSQPPFLSSMVRDVFEKTNDKEWLSAAYKTLCKEYKFWQTKKLAANGLNGYFGYDSYPEDPEKVINQFCVRCKLDRSKIITEEQRKETCLGAFSTYESGWDCTSRFKENGHNHNTVDLNSLLYIFEENMRYFSEVLSFGEESLWQERKDARLKKVNDILWCEKEGLFLDYNFKTDEFSKCKTTASFYPLYAKLASKEQAKKTVALLNGIETKYGVACSEEAFTNAYQWDYPNIWAPQQYIVYKGLLNYGYEQEAKRIAEKYVHLIENNFEEAGCLWEKYSGITGEVANPEYKTQARVEMLGWTSGVYIAFSDALDHKGEE